MLRATQDRETLARLKALADVAEDQAALAVTLLETRQSLLIVQAALEVLSETPMLSARSALLNQYAHFDADGARRDSGGMLRILIIKALRALRRQDDVPLLERAASTYEYSLIDRSEIGSALRAEALTALADFDPEMAAYHAARLLVDPLTDAMSGEPAVTAARVLAALGRLVPLYGYVHMAQVAVPELTAEALRGLERLPASLLPSVIERFRAVEDETVLAGLFDLLLLHPARSISLPFFQDFLQQNQSDEMLRYLTTLMVADGGDDLLAVLGEIARTELRPHRRDILRDALSVRRGSPKIDALLRALGTKR